MSFSNGIAFRLYPFSDRMDFKGQIKEHVITFFLIHLDTSFYEGWFIGNIDL
jgi:hypothetical protein